MQVVTSPNKRYTLRRLIGGSGSAKPCSGFALCTILLHHILPALVLLRKPLSGQSKRRIPGTLYDSFASRKYLIILKRIYLCCLCVTFKIVVLRCKYDFFKCFKILFCVSILIFFIKNNFI